MRARHEALGFTGHLPNFDEVSVRVADIAARLACVFLGFGMEHRTARAPQLVRSVHVGNAQVQRDRQDVARLRGLCGYGRLVVRWPSPPVDNEPTVGDAEHRRLTVAHHGVKDLFVVGAGSRDVVNNKQRRDDEAFHRCWEIRCNERRICWIRHLRIPVIVLGYVHFHRSDSYLRRRHIQVEAKQIGRIILALDLAKSGEFLGAERMLDEWLFVAAKKIVVLLARVGIAERGECVARFLRDFDHGGIHRGRFQVQQVGRLRGMEGTARRRDSGEGAAELLDLELH